MCSDLLTVANGNEDWALIPSDPAIFNDMLREYNAKDIKVQEVYSLDFEHLKKEGTIHGMIFASECREEDLSATHIQSDPEAEGITYAAQIITNICGTLALLSILFNTDVPRGETLDQFLEFTKGFSSIDRGMALGNSPLIYKIHHAYTTSQHLSDHRLLDLEAALDSENQDFEEAVSYHYVSYIFKNGYVWELDGLKGRPIKLSACSEGHWLDTLKPILETRMSDSSNEGIAFNLMAVMHDSLRSKKNEVDVYKDCIHQIGKAQDFTPINTEAHRDSFFAAHSTSTLEGHSVMQELWRAQIAREETTIADKSKKLIELKNSLQNEVENIEANNNMTMADVIRMKFDYFPFLKKVLHIAHQKDLLKAFKKPLNDSEETKAHKTKGVRKKKGRKGKN
ncbi:hypothetical protein BY458DRAFT_505403 [Sporodiniella umbellata]|nr:hypothetical protein BY458DRAFT_505403 [Sporodiniella umbellata]